MTLYGCTWERVKRARIEYVVYIFPPFVRLKQSRQGIKNETKLLLHDKAWARLLSNGAVLVRVALYTHETWTKIIAKAKKVQMGRTTTMKTQPAAPTRIQQQQKLSFFYNQKINVTQQSVLNLARAAATMI